jgi:hypothetical protein
VRFLVRRGLAIAGYVAALAGSFVLPVSQAQAQSFQSAAPQVVLYDVDTRAVLFEAGGDVRSLPPPVSSS